MAKLPSLSLLKNIGVTVAARLEEIGITTRADLRRVGPAAAYRQMKERRPNETLPKCYYLYSLEAALRDIDWRKLTDAEKRRLVQAVEPKP